MERPNCYSAMLGWGDNFRGSVLYTPLCSIRPYHWQYGGERMGVTCKYVHKLMDTLTHKPIYKGTVTQGFYSCPYGITTDAMQFRASSCGVELRIQFLCMCLCGWQHSPFTQPVFIPRISTLIIRLYVQLYRICCINHSPILQYIISDLYDPSKWGT